MAAKKSSPAPRAKKSVQTPSRSAKIAQAGVGTGAQFASLMSALMTDIITGSITPEVGNATCNAGGKLLKVVEMQYRHGKQKFPLKLASV